MTCFLKCCKFPAIKGTFESSTYKFRPRGVKKASFASQQPLSQYGNSNERLRKKNRHATWLKQMDVNGVMGQMARVWRCCKATVFPYQGLSLLSPGPGARWGSATPSPPAVGTRCSVICVGLHGPLRVPLARTSRDEGARQKPRQARCCWVRGQPGGLLCPQGVLLAGS